MTALATALTFLVAGAALAAVHFGALALNVTLFTNAERRWLAVPVLVARIALTVAGFVMIARYGALPLLFAAAGFAGARPFMLRRARTTP